MTASIVVHPAAYSNLNGDSDLTALESKYVRVTWFESISAGTSGTITVPTGGTIVLDAFAGGVDALCSTVENAWPTFASPLTSGGAVVAATLDGAGNWTLSAAPSSYPIALIYQYRVSLGDIDDTKMLGAEMIDNMPGAMPVVSDGVTIEGDGTSGLPLTIKITPAQAATYSTGHVYGGELSVNLSGKVDIAAGMGVVVDAYTDPEAPIVHVVTWSAFTDLEPSDIATVVSRTVGINKNGTVVWSSPENDFSPTARRDTIILGWVDSIDLATITDVQTEPHSNLDGLNQLRDLMEALGQINMAGNDYLPASTNLTIQKTAGTTFQYYSNFDSNHKSPHIITNDAITTCDILYFYQTSPGVWDNTLSAVTNIDPDQYDTGSGLASVPAGKWTIQIISMYPSPQYNDIQYGQAYYDTMADAKAALNNAVTINPYNLPDSFRTFLIVQQGCTNLADTAKAYFYNAGMLGLFGGGGGVGGSSSAGTVTAFSFANANGVSGSVTNPTTTPELTLSLGNIEPTSVNGLTLAESTTSFTVKGGTSTERTLTVNGDATISGTCSGSNTGDQTISDATISTSDVTTNDASTTKHGFMLKATAPAAGLVNYVGIGNGETSYSNRALLDSVNPASLGSVGPGSSLLAARRDHVHPMPALDTLSVPTDITTLNATTSAHGLLVKATAPTSGLLNVVGIGNGETAYTMKAVFDNTNPAALGVAGPGTALVAARRDHIHTMPTKSDVGLSNVANVDTTNAANISSGVLGPDRLGTGSALQVARRNAGNTALEYVTLAGGGDMLASNNLSDVANVTTARNNILPSKTGNSLKVLRVNAGETDYELATASGGSPAGNTGEVQYNNGGAFAGAANVEISAAGNLNLVATTDPSVPSGAITLYGKSIAGRIMPKFIGPAGIDTPFQPAFFQNRIILWTPGTSTTPLYSGQTPTLAATCSHPTPSTGAIGTIISRAQFATSTTAGNAAGLRSPVGTILIGNATNRGGFFLTARFNQGSLHTTGVQKMIGLSSSTSALAGEPSSSMNDFIGMCLDSTDANWQFSRRTGSGAATKVNLGVAAAANQLFELIMFIAPSGTDLYVRIGSYNNDGTLTTLLDTSYNTSLPAVTTLLGIHFQVRNGALAAAHNMAMSRIYLESDF